MELLISLCILLQLYFLVCRYSESLYALLSIGGTYLLMCGVNNVPVLLFALSGSVRSNGVLNAGYYGFKALHQSYYAMNFKKRVHVSTNNSYHV